MSKKQSFSLNQYEIDVNKIYRNCSPALLYEMAVRDEAGTMIANNGALVAYSGEKTGRSPKDKRMGASEI